MAFEGNWRPEHTAHWKAPDKQPANGWAKDDQPVQVNKQFGPIPPADPELEKLLRQTEPAADKNTPTSLRQLRWHIYAAVDVPCTRIELKILIEELFKQYTNS